MKKGDIVPKHWTQSDWEDKAKENPLHAIMTTEQFKDKTLEDLADGAPEEFLAKGRKIYERMIDPFLRDEERAHKLEMFDYGCGAGRIMNAVIEHGHIARGADISPTMIEACRRLAPTAASLHVVGESGDVGLPDGACDVAYSFAVVQHIAQLSTFEKAVREMARIVKSDGLMSLQCNCPDFDYGTIEEPGFSRNFEAYSEHYAEGGAKLVKKHQQNNWSGVYIGADRMATILAEAGMRIVNLFHWNPESKRRSVVFVARKQQGESVFRPRPSPF